MNLFKKGNFTSILTDLDYKIIESDGVFINSFLEYIPHIFRKELEHKKNNLNNHHFLTRIILNYKYYPVIIMISKIDDSILKFDITFDLDLYFSMEFNNFAYYLEYDHVKKKFLSVSCIDYIEINSIIEDLSFEGKNIIDESRPYFKSFIDNITDDTTLPFCYIQIKNDESKYEWYLVKRDFISKANSDICYIAFFNINSDFAKRFEMLKQALRDPLTGVLQRDSISDYISNAISNENTKTGSIILLDIDYYKRINDAYGHTFGDLVLVQVSKVLFEITRKKGRNGRVGRVGGDEFLLFFPNVFLEEDVRLIAREIREKTLKINFEQIKSFYVTTTLGIVTFPDNGNDFNLLYKKADIALYRGKKKGKNCYIIYDENKHGKVSDDDEVLDLHDIAKNGRETLVNYSVLLDSFDLLINKDIANLANTLLSCFNMIARFYTLDRLLIRFRDNENCNHDLIYNSTSSEGLENHTVEKYCTLTPFFTTDNIFIYNKNDTLKYRDSSIKQQLTSFKADSFVVIKLDLPEDQLGYISYQMTTVKRKWQDDEILSFKMFSKLISSSIKKYIKTFGKLPE